jgi:hypothetical protein
VVLRASAILLLCLPAVVAAQSPAPKPAPRRAAARNPAVERGRHLMTVSGCHDCHTPKKMGPRGPEADMTRALSGHPEGSALPAPPKLPEGPWVAVATWDLTAWAGPWGVTYATNLTPDRNTGMGIWTEEMFVKAMKTGKHMGAARPILPPMPVEAIKQNTDADLRAMFAYLRSLPAVKNRVPEPVIAEAPGQ